MVDAATRLKSLTAMAQLGQHPGAAEVFQAHSEGVAIRLDRIAQQLHSHNTSNDDVIHEIITRLKTLSSSLTHCRPLSEYDEAFGDPPIEMPTEQRLEELPPSATSTTSVAAAAAASSSTSTAPATAANIAAAMASVKFAPSDSQQVAVPAKNKAPQLPAAPSVKAKHGEQAEPFTDPLSGLVLR